MALHERRETTCQYGNVEVLMYFHVGTCPMVLPIEGPIIRDGEQVSATEVRPRMMSSEPLADGGCRASGRSRFRCVEQLRGWKGFPPLCRGALAFSMVPTA
jgi:hypothetical protein